MMEPYTPGPWTFDENAGQNGYRILAKQGPIDVSPATANGLPEARLIAAAPSMFEACKCMMRWFTFVGMDDDAAEFYKNLEQLTEYVTGVKYDPLQDRE